jgi:CHASE2 domain-containing sensor protein
MVIYWLNYEHLVDKRVFIGTTSEGSKDSFITNFKGLVRI